MTRQQTAEMLFLQEQIRTNDADWVILRRVRRAFAKLDESLGRQKSRDQYWRDLLDESDDDE